MALGLSGTGLNFFIKLTVHFIVCSAPRHQLGRLDFPVSLFRWHRDAIPSHRSKGVFGADSDISSAVF